MTRRNKIIKEFPLSHQVYGEVVEFASGYPTLYIWYTDDPSSREAAGLASAINLKCLGFKANIGGPVRLSKQDYRRAFQDTAREHRSVVIDSVYNDPTIAHLREALTEAMTEGSLQIMPEVFYFGATSHNNERTLISKIKVTRNGNTAEQQNSGKGPVLEH